MNSPLNSTKIRKYYYVFECALEEVRIKVRFPCRISISWNYGQGETRTLNSKALTGGVAKFEQRLTFSTVVFFDEEKQQFAEHKSTIEISIVTDNGTSLAGFVPLDLGGLLNRKDRREMFEIERCPDRSASLKMRLTFKAGSERIRNKVRVVHTENVQDSEPEDEAMMMRPITLARSVTPHSQYGFKSVHDRKVMRSPEPQPTARISSSRDILDKEMMILKSRLAEVEGKYKGQRTEKQKLSETLKIKEDVYFSMKTEMKRKEIQLGDLYRNLQEYRSDYERIKCAEEDARKECDRVKKLLEHTERTTFEKITKLELENTTNEKKYQKMATEFEKMRKEKETMALQTKVKLEEWFKDRETMEGQMKLLRKDKEELMKQVRTDRQSWDKMLRQLNKKLKNTEEELENYKNTVIHSEKKLTKLDQMRAQELNKLKTQISEIDKVRQTLAVELQSLKYCSSRKQQSQQQIIKNLQAKLTDQKATVAFLKSQNSQLQVQTTSLQADNNSLKRQLVILQQKRSFTEEMKVKFENDSANFRSQVNALTQQVNAKNIELKFLQNKNRQLQETYQIKIVKMKETHDQSILTLQRKMTELRHIQETKIGSSTKLLTKKERQLEDAMNREQRLSTMLENARQEARKIDSQHRQKIQQLRKNEASLRQTVQTLSKQLQCLQQQSSTKLISHMSTIKTLQSDILQLQQSLSDSTQRQRRLRDQLSRLSQQADQGHQIKILLEQQEGRLRECEWHIEELNEEVRARTASEIEQSNGFREMKERVVELETEVAKKDNAIRDREKIYVNNRKEMEKELEDRAKQLVKLDAENRVVQDELKEALRRERAKIDVMTLEYEKLNNELTLTKGQFDKSFLSLQQTQKQLRNLRQANKSTVEERDCLSSQVDRLQSLTSQLKQSNLTLQSSLMQKDKQLRKAKHYILDLQQRLQQQSRCFSRNQPLILQILEIAAKIDSPPSFPSNTLLESNEHIPDEFDRLGKLKKIMSSVEFKVRKMTEELQERDGRVEREKGRELAESQRLGNELAKAKEELGRVRKEYEELTINANILRGQHDQVMFRSQQVETENIQIKKTVTQIQLRLKSTLHEKELAEQEMKNSMHRYEGLLEETRLTLSEKAERQRKQMLATIKKLQQKAEQQQERLFNYELQVQKLSQRVKKDEQNKRLLAKGAEVQKQYTGKLHQAVKKYEALQVSMQSVTWEKKHLQDILSSTLSKSEKAVMTLQSQLQQAQTKNRSLFQQNRLLEDQSKRHQQTINKLNQQLITVKTLSKQQIQKLTTSELKLKNELNRSKVETTQLKRSIQQQNQRLGQLQQLKLIKASLEQQLLNRDNLLTTFQQKQEKLSEQMLSLRHQFEEIKEEYERKVEFKQNQIMELQEELFKINSKDNVRYLKDSQAVDKVRALQAEKRVLIKEISQIKMHNSQLKEQHMIYQNQNGLLHDIIKENKVSALQIMNKQDSIDKLHDEIVGLNMENSRLKELVKTSKYQQLLS